MAPLPSIFFKTKFFFCIPGHLVIVGEEVFVLVVVHSLSCVRLLSALWTAARKAPLCFTVSWSLLTFMSIELLIPYSHRNLCRPYSVCPQSFPASGSFLMSWLFTSSGQSWSFSFSIGPSTAYSGLISFRIDWFVLLAVQGPLKSPLYFEVIVDSHALVRNNAEVWHGPMDLCPMVASCKTIEQMLYLGSIRAQPGFCY